jgi:hypothetical protein
MEDAYGASLWDIYPTCQVSGIGHGHPVASAMQQSIQAQYDADLKDTVIVDGLKAAKVRWKSFAPVSTVKRPTIMRRILEAILSWSSILLAIGVLLFALSRGNALFIIVGICFFVPGIIGVLLTPEILLKRAGGKIWGNQPWLFGIEGYCNIGDIEAAIFGINLGHLKWTAFGSPLSRHEPNQYGEVVGLDPMTFPDVKQLVDTLRATKESRVCPPLPVLALTYPILTRYIDIYACRYTNDDRHSVCFSSSTNCFPPRWI